MSDNNTISAPEDFPIISEKQANSILDNLMGDLHLHDDKGEELVLSTVDKLKAAFGDKGVVVAQLILVAAARGFDHG